MYNAKDYELEKEENIGNTSVIANSKYGLIYDRSYYSKNGREDMLSTKNSYVPPETIFFD
jgi:hypothetical protein